jgi:hypothetical protein
MAASDASIPISQIDIASIVISDGSNSLTVSLAPASTLEWTEETTPYVEVMHQGKHVAGGPVLRQTGDSNCTGKLVAYVTSYLGASNETPYEVMTRKGTAASWGTTGVGDKKSSRMVVTETAPSGASQTITFNYVVFTNVQVGYENGIRIVTADFTDHENTPTVA